MSILRQRRAFLASLAGVGLSLPLLRSEALGRQLEALRSDEEIAGTDRVKFPVESRKYVAYFTTSTVVEGEARENLASVLKVIVPSLSNRTELKHQIPVQIADTVYRIDLLGLGWESVWFKVLSQFYPYYSITVDRYKYVPQIVRADWFCADLFDEVETKEAQYLLLYSGKVPKNRQEFLDFWKVQNESEFIYGMIEGKSGVAVNDKSGQGNNVRQMENRTTARRGYAWITKDSARIAGATDPVKNLHLGPEGTEYDASEYIVGIYKVLNGQSGCLQAYFLTDGNRKLANGQRQVGTRQAKAPVDIVEDDTNTRGREIRNGSSCIYCHTKGIIPPTQNEYRRYILRDTRFSADYKTKYEIERYQGSDLEQEVRLNQELYASAVKACSGLTPEEFSHGYQDVVRQYISPITLEALARELSIYYPAGYLTEEELQNALAYASGKGILDARASAIGTKDSISRDMLLSDWYGYQEIISLWRRKAKP